MMNTHVRVSKILFDFSLCHKYLWVNIYLQVMEQRSFLLFYSTLFCLNIQRDFTTGCQQRFNSKARKRKMARKSRTRIFSLRNCLRILLHDRTLELLWKNDSLDKIFYLQIWRYQINIYTVKIRYSIRSDVTLITRIITLFVWNKM